MSPFGRNQWRRNLHLRALDTNMHLSSLTEQMINSVADPLVFTLQKVVKMKSFLGLVALLGSLCLVRTQGGSPTAALDLQKS